jgi:hypothetical protein
LGSSEDEGTSKFKNSSQCTLADQRAVTGSSKAAVMPLYVVLQTQYRSADWEEAQGKPVQVIYKRY